MAWIFSPFMMSEKSSFRPRSEEHTSELQSQSNLVCRLLLEKKKKMRRPQAEAHGSAPHDTMHACVPYVFAARAGVARLVVRATPAGRSPCTRASFAHRVVSA